MVLADVDAAVVTVCAAAAVLVAVGLAAAASPPAAGLLVADTAVEDEDEEPAPAAMPMMNRSPQHARNAVSTLCLATHGSGRCGPPGGTKPGCGQGDPSGG